jgi:glycosyltransferase involved in cell wall biosynthesis
MRVLPVSAVIPAYNREREVVEAIGSVRAQTRPPAEILVVDDGSTDGTAAAAEAAGARVLRQENRGVSAARNAGVEAANQPWIAFLDSDDLWEPDRLERQWEALALAPDVGLVFSDHAVFDETGVTVPSALATRRPYRRVAKHELAPGVFRCEGASLGRAMFGGNLVKPSTVLVRRDLLEDVGLFDSTFGHAEDRELGLRLLARTDALVVERPLVRYRVHAGAASADPLEMTLGAITVGDRVLANPARYPAGAADHFRRDRPRRLREAGLLLMERDRFSEARQVLRRSLRAKPSLRTVAALAAAFLGRSAYRALVRVKRGLGLPGVRKGGIPA